MYASSQDIPEGGAKAVVLVNTPAMPAAARFFAVRKSVKGFTDSLLDLIVNDRYVLHPRVCTSLV